MLDAVGQAVMATEPDGTLIFWNRAAERLYGWSAAEVLGRNVMDVTPSDATKEQAHRIMASVRAGACWEGTFQVRRRDGSVFPAFVTDTPVFDDGGELIAIIGVSTDLTERIRAEEEVRRSEERFRTALKYSPVVFASVDADLRYEWMLNPHPDFDAAAVVGKRDDELDSGPGIAAMIALKQRVLEQGIQERREITFARSDRDLTYDVTATPVRDAGGRVRSLVTASLDITERKRAEEELRRSERRFARLFHASPIAGCILALPDLRFLDVNERYEALTGHSRTSLLGRTTREAGLSTTTAFTTWPRSSSGAPTTAHSCTASCSSSTFSTSGPAML